MKKLGLPVVLAMVLMTALACSSSTNKSSSAAFNAADVTFAQSMIPHHRQAVQMADLALKQGKDAKVLDLARRIKAAQDPEIVKMEGWLKQWGKDAPMAGDTMGAGMHGSGTDSGAVMPGEGMMSAADMGRLQAATGAEFDKLFLSQMIQHHQGAIAMARTELRDGKSSEAKSLATGIVKAQEAEITEMKQLEPTIA